jgi:PilZ domain
MGFMALENPNGGVHSPTYKPAAGAPQQSPGSAATAAPAPATAPKGRFNGSEKRRSPRYKCEGSIEMREEGRGALSWATFTDISLHGCYVEAASTYAAGTYLRIKLSANGCEVHTHGVVRVSYSALGMGLAFTEMSEEDRTRLKSLLQTISRPSVIMGPKATPAVSSALGAKNVPQVFHPAAAIQAMVQYFENRQMLMRDEFLRILRKSQQAEEDPSL